eukprot:Pgem_evm1s2545
MSKKAFMLQNCSGRSTTDAFYRGPTTAILQHWVVNPGTHDIQRCRVPILTSGVPAGQTGSRQ